LDPAAASDRRARAARDPVARARASPAGRLPLGAAAILLAGLIGTAQAATPAARPRLAAIEATEEAVYNSMLKATTTTGNGHTIEALPIERVTEILKEHHVIR
jgi:L-aminopeptidase/D-esterase-like protein